jgi:hypothetical protein
MSGLTIADKEALRRVKRLLYEDWNPLGVYVPADEYDSYALQLFGRLKRGASAEEAANYLASVQVEWLEEPVTQEHNLAVARKALALM